MLISVRYYPSGVVGVFICSCVCVCVCVCVCEFVNTFRTRGRTFVLTSCCQRIEYRVVRRIPWVRIKNLSYRTNEMYYDLCRYT